MGEGDGFEEVHGGAESNLLVVAVEEVFQDINGFFVDSCERHHVGIEMGFSALAQFAYEVRVLISPAVDGFSGDADGFGDFGVGFTGEDVGGWRAVVGLSGLSFRLRAWRTIRCRLPRGPPLSCRR